MKHESVKSVTFIDLQWKEHVAIVLGRIEDERADLKYLEKGDITIAYDVPKQSDRTKRFCWK